MADNIDLMTRCPCCNKMTMISVDFEAWNRWQEGELIQNAFPMLNFNQREQIKTGFCPACWNKMFGVYDDC